MTSNDNFTGQFSVTTDPATGKVTYQFDKGDSVSEAKEYILLLQQLGQLPMNANAFDIMGHEHPSPQQLLDARLEVKASKSGGIWLSDLAQAFGDEMLKTNAWGTPNTWTQTYGPILRDFREIVSRSKRTITRQDGMEEAIWDIPASELAEEHIQTYCDAMWKFPMNAGSMKDIADAKQALNTGREPQARSNAFKKIRMVGTFLKWAYKKKKILQELDELLPVEKIDKKRDRGNDGYQPYTDKELKLIFERPTYPDGSIGWKFWTPLLALYTGARANEIAQLLVTDFVTTSGGINCIVILDLEDDIDDDDPLPAPDEKPKKSVKTAASRRWVPIHPKLVELGFLNYVEHIKGKGEARLFPELTYDPRNGYGRKVSRDFAQVTKTLGIWVKRKKVFHSFRGTLNGRLLRLGMSQELRDYALGHTNDSMNVQHYAKRVEDRPYEAILEWLSKVDFGLDHKAWEPKIKLPEL